MTGPYVATTGPLVLPVLTLAVNVSAPSVVKSGVGVTVKNPELFVIVKFPDRVPKSPSFVTVQYKVVPFGTFVVATLNVREVPSFTLSVAGVTVYVGSGVRLVSLIVTEIDLTTSGPPVLPVLRIALNVSAPSVVRSFLVVTVKFPIPPVIGIFPDVSTKSPSFVTVQYKVVTPATLVVTSNLRELFSFTLFATGVTV